MTAEQLKVGDSVVVRGMGLGKLKAHKDGRWVIGLASKDEAEVKDGKVDALLRSPMSAEEAASVYETLRKKEGAPDTRDWGEQYLDIQRALKHGSPIEQAAILHGLYRLADPDASQQRVMESFEEALLPELAQVLKKKVGTLRGELHAAQPALGYTAPERDDKPIPPLGQVPQGWNLMGGFRIFSGKLVIGECPYPSKEADTIVLPDGVRRTLVVPCENGEWFALNSEDEENEYDYVVGTRAAIESFKDVMGKLSDVGSVAVEGGEVHVIDDEVRDDRRYQKELENGAEPLGRGFAANMGGDGAVGVQGARTKSPGLKLPWSKPEGPYCLFKIA